MTFLVLTEPLDSKRRFTTLYGRVEAESLTEAAQKLKCEIDLANRKLKFQEFQETVEVYIVPLIGVNELACSQDLRSATSIPCTSH